MPTFRGLPVQELCRRCSFEEVAYLAWQGELPGRDQLSAQNRVERAQRALPAAVAAAIAEQPFAADPVDTLRMAVTLLGGNDPAKHELSPATVRAEALRLFAVLPSIIAMDQRRRQGLGAIAPREHLGYAANFLYMTFGKVPEPQIVAAFETSLILYADAPDFAQRTVAPSSPGFRGAVASAIETLRGSDERGGSGAVLKMINEIAIPDNAGPWLEEALAGGRRIAGFCHRLDKSEDPRVPAMRRALGMVASLRRGQDLVEVCDALATAMYDMTRRHPSLDYPASLAHHLIGFDTSTYLPVIAAARLPGWTAHIAAQVAASSLARPGGACDGSAERPAASG